MNLPSFKRKEPSASSKAMARAVVGVGYGVIGAVVLFFDVMTIKLLYARFPDGLFRYSAIGGILATGVTIIALAVGKSHWFRPGGQMNWAWVMTGVELTVSVMNVIAAFNPDGMAWWVLIMPATPVLAVVTWILMIFFSPERAQLHAQMEMEDQQHKSNLDYAKAEHEAHMQLKHSFLQQFQGFLQEETNSPENLAILRQAAARLGKQVISGLINAPIAMQGSQYALPQQASNEPAKEVTGHRVAMPQQSDGVIRQYQDFIKEQAQAASTGVPSDMTDEEMEQTLQRFHAYYEARRAARERNTSPLAPAPSQNGNGAKPTGN
jgi:hypothetical protein